MGRPIEGLSSEPADPEVEEGADPCEEEEEDEFDFEGEETDEVWWLDPSAEQGGVLGRLFEAAESGDLSALSALAPQCRAWLEAGARGPDGDTALHVAALYGHEACVFALLDAGADVRAVDAASSTVLHDASAGGSLAAVARVLELAPELVGAVDDDEETALHCAARGGFAAIVAALLAAGAPKDLLNVAGQTALMVVDADDADTARLLSA